jgi:hypothetical protein
MNVTIYSTNVVNNLNKMKQLSTQSLVVLLTEMAQYTMTVSRDTISSNGGDLANSHRITTLNSGSYSSVKLSAGEGIDYLGYYYYGTNGSWKTSKDSPTLVESKMSKYGYTPDSQGYYHWKGQKAHKFLEDALTIAYPRDISIARERYREFISRGTG